MKLSARFDRDDVAPVMDHIERPIERSNELAGRGCLKGNFVVSVGRNNKNEATTHFNLGRRGPEITITHTRSPDSTIRQALNDSFVMSGNLTWISLGAGAFEVPALAPFSIALVT